MEILEKLIAPAIGLIGVWVGSRLKQKADIKIQKEFLAREIRIKKLEEISMDISDKIREVVYPTGIMNKRLLNEIVDGDFRILNDEHQDRMTKLYRNVRVKKLFLSLDYQKQIEEFYDKYLLIADKVYEGFHNLNTKKKRYNKDEVTYDAIHSQIQKCANFGYEIMEKINNDLLKELEALK